MVSDDPESFADLDGHAGSQGTSAETGSAPTCASTGQTGGSSADGCGSQAPNLAEDQHQTQSHTGSFGLVQDWLDVIEISGSYGVGASVQGQAGVAEGRAGVGGEAEGTIGLGGGNKEVEVFAGGQASGKLGPAEGEVKAGITVSSNEGLSLSAEAKGAVGPTGGGVKVDSSGVHSTLESQKKSDTKIGAHIQVGLGIGAKVNFSQAARAFGNTQRSASALISAMGDKLRSYGAMISNAFQPSFGPHTD